MKRMHLTSKAGNESSRFAAAEEFKKADTAALLGANTVMFVYDDKAER